MKKIKNEIKLETIEVMDIKKIHTTNDREMTKIINDSYYSIGESKLSIRFKFVIDEPKITCYVVDEDDKVYTKGICRCHPDDEFSIKDGMVLAEFRAKKNIYEYMEKKLLKQM